MLAIGHGPASVTVGALFGTLAVFVIFLSTGPIATSRDRAGEPPPEGHPFRPYAGRAVDDYLERIGAEGRTLYRRSLIQDIAFLVLNGAGFVLLIDGTLVRAFADPGPLVRYGLPAIGVAAALVDALEDLFLWIALRGDQPAEDGPARVACVFTHAKWTLILAASAAIGSGAVLLAFRGSGSI